MRVQYVSFFLRDEVLGAVQCGTEIMERTEAVFARKFTIHIVKQVVEGGCVWVMGKTRMRVVNIHLGNSRR